MKAKLIRTEKLCDFFVENQVEFSKQLFEEAVNVKGEIEEIHRVGDIDLMI